MFIDTRQPAPRAAATAAGSSALARYVHWAPLLWLLGVLQLAAAWLIVRSAWRHRPEDRAVRRIVLLWLSIGILQSVSAVVNGLLMGDTLAGVRHAFSLSAVGWVFAGLGLAMGAGADRCGSADARLFAKLSLYTLFIGGGTLLAMSLGVEQTQFGTPVSLLLGDRESVRSGAWVRLAIQEVTWGEVVPRLILMYPWPTGLGIGSLGLALISTRTLGWMRWLGVGGGLVGVVFSWSRLAMLSALLVMYLLIVMRCRTWVRAGLIAVPAAMALATLADAQAFPYLLQAWEAVGNARAGSSMARDLIYEKSWEAFLQSPWIGHGWVGGSVHPIEHLPIGSHSTVYGTLYTGGVVVFGAFGLAMLAALTQVGRGLLQTQSPDSRADREIGLCLLLVLCAASLYESLYSLVLPCFFYFVWIGMSMTPPRAAASPVREPVAAVIRTRHSTFHRKPSHATHN
jgi:hypothetical protein